MIDVPSYSLHMMKLPFIQNVFSQITSHNIRDVYINSTDILKEACE
jgi:hypothetical protein